MIKNFKQMLSNDRGFAGGVNAKVAGLFGALILIVILASLAPTMFTGLNATGGPTWLDTVLPIVVAGGLVFVAWRAFN